MQLASTAGSNQPFADATNRRTRSSRNLQDSGTILVAHSSALTTNARLHAGFGGMTELLAEGHRPEEKYNTAQAGSSHYGDERKILRANKQNHSGEWNIFDTLVLDLRTDQTKIQEGPVLQPRAAAAISKIFITIIHNRLCM